MAKSARAIAVAILARVLRKRQSLNTAIPAEIAALTEPAERALARELVFGVMRWYPRLDYYLRQLLKKPLKAKDADVRCALLIGLYQLAYMRLPDYAAVSATVELAKHFHKPWARGLLNGVLRQYQRSADELAASADADAEAASAHPLWLLRRIKAAWPDDWPAIIDANNRQAPMVLRVNRRIQPREAYLQRLMEQGLEAVRQAFSDDGLVLERACDVSVLPGFAEGEVSVQDGAAQLAAVLLQPEPSQRVLDACAAPGGKTAHILERQPELASLTAIDVSETRLEQIRETLDRLQLEADVRCADVAEPKSWWDGQPFDRILLDAPCSASGVIRRNPDIKYLRQDGDIATLAAEQKRILEALWPLLAPGGRLLYATCSILPEENHRQIAAFIEGRDDAKVLPMNVGWGRACEVGRQILPGEQGMDGFYYACLQKREMQADN